ncbi:MAG: gamma-glutamylcyclotransferase, partial [Actinobacteria bacterium]|nr:gamma-glutamylcyclotransferase [Actinomycetota bacterium]
MNEAQLRECAEVVGHEPSTLRKQYLVPWLEDAYMKDGTVIDRLDKRASGSVSYFAYGSNMDPVQMAHRAPDAVPIGTATLRDHDVVFAHVPD